MINTLARWVKVKKTGIASIQSYFLSDYHYTKQMVDASRLRLPKNGDLYPDPHREKWTSHCRQETSDLVIYSFYLKLYKNKGLART